jgi:hypothetical protein
MGCRTRAHQHRELGEILLGQAVFVHVARGDEAVIGGNGRTQRHLVVGMADLRQRCDRSIAALPGQAIFTPDHKHMARDAGIDQMVCEHRHGEPGGAADLHGVRVGRTDSKMLGEHGREHDVRRDGGVAAEDAVDLGAREPGIRYRKRGGLAHEIERG